MGGPWRLFEQNETCKYQNVSYSHRVDDPESYDWCIVPDSGYDGVLFAGVALLAACCLQGKFSALWILLAGGACQAIAFPINTGRWGNAIALWLGITPADLFLYVFLPPMLVDAAVRISYFHFRKMLLHVISFAFLMVLASTFIMIPVLLYLFGLESQGWYWQHAALFAAMIGSTDAVAVGAILKAGGSAPEHLILILEGESLFNDATSITLFEIMLDLVKQLGQSPATGKESAMQVVKIAGDIVWLAIGGMLFGLLFGFLTRQVLKFIKRGGHKAPEQLALSLAMAYLAFYTSQVAGVSGVIAVVVFGLYGSANAKWNMSSAVTETPVFTSFWDTVSFMLNGIVFFYAGASSVNFFWRSSEELYKSEGSLNALFITFWRLPLIYLAMLVVRCLCICLLNPIFRLAGSHMSAGEIVFATIGGLRGAISLILAQMLVTQADPNPDDRDEQKVTAQIALWTAGVVVLTLLINAPLLPFLIKWTGLAEVSAVKARIRGKAVRALLRYTKAAIHDLHHDEDEMLRGVDWKTVRSEVDMSEKLSHLLADQSHEERPPKVVPRRGLWKVVHLLCCCVGIQAVEESKLLQPLLPDKKDSSDPADERDSHDPDRANLHRNMEARANAIWEEAEEGDLEGGITSGLDADAMSSVKTQGGRAAKGRVIGKVQGKSGNPRDQASMSAEVPFSRVSRRNSSTSSIESHSPTHQVIDMEGRQPQTAEDSSREGQGTGANRPPGIPRPPPIRTSRVSDAEWAQSEPLQLSQEALQQHNDGSSASGELLEPFAELSTSIYYDAPLGKASSAAPSDLSTAFSEVEEKFPWEPEVLSTEGTAEGPIPASPPQFRGVEKRDSKGNTYSILPQPVLQPKMVKPEDEDDSVIEQPVMRWMTVDLAELRRQQQRDLDNGRGPPDLTHPSVPSLRSRSSRADARMLKRAMSGPIGRHLAPDQNLLTDNHPDILVEARVRLVAGLKRYFHGKRAEGLLSAKGMQLLDFACDLQMDHAERPLFMWAFIEREVCGHLKVRFLSRALFALRKFGVSLRSWRPRVLVNFFLQGPNRRMSRALASSLSSVMLLALEVAVEYWLALSWSPQAQWLSESEASSTLQNEAKVQSQQVWKFIINREIEAPARFQAIQTYRAAMAILLQQQHFVGQLYSSGMVDESERELILGPIQRQERMLQRQGPHWRAPSISEVLRKLPFLAELPERFFDLIVGKGLLLKYDRQDIIWAPPDRENEEAEDAVAGGAPCERSGIYIVIAGLINRSFTSADGKTEELLMGSGGVFGLTSSLIGESLPGSGPAVAVGNALAQGPVVFHLPQHVIDELEQKAKEGIPEAVQLRVDLFRVAGLFVVERLKSEVVAAAVTHYQALALHKTRRRALRRLAKKYDAKCPKHQVGRLWLRVKDIEGARKLVERELEHALDTSGPDVNEYEEASDDEDTKGNTMEDARKSTLESTERGAIPSGKLMTDQDIMNCMSAEKLWRKVRKRAAEALARLKEGIRDADLLELEPHEVMEHHSSVVLLKGTLHTAGRASYIPPAAGSHAPSLVFSSGAGTPPAGGQLQSGQFGEVEQSPEGVQPPGEWVGREKDPQQPGSTGGQNGSGKNARWEVAVAYKGPCVLPWLWEDVTFGGEVLLKPQPIPFRAGPEGATLVVCMGDGARDTSDGSPTAESQPEHTVDVLSSLSRPSVGPLAGRQNMQGILDSQSRQVRRQNKLPEGAEAETAENIMKEPAQIEFGRGKQLRVLSIKPM